jgi:hypothetical protein
MKRAKAANLREASGTLAKMAKNFDSETSYIITYKGEKTPLTVLLFSRDMDLVKRLIATINGYDKEMALRQHQERQREKAKLKEKNQKEKKPSAG